MDLIGVSFPTKGYSTLWGGIGQVIIWVWKKLVVLPWVGARLFFFCVEKKSQMRLAFLD